MFFYDSGLYLKQFSAAKLVSGIPQQSNPMDSDLISPIPSFIYIYLFHPATLGILSIVLSWVLVADIRLLALKFKNYSWKNNQFRYILVGLSVVLLSTLWYRGVPLVIALYFGLSILYNIIEERRTQDEVHS